jgi:trehalose-6-phosphate synthase
MSLEERRERWQSMVGKLRKSPVQNWFSEFLTTLTDTRHASPPLVPSRPAAVPMVIGLAANSRTAQRY